jgi:hypothetical protein
LPARLRLTDPQRATLATIGKRLGRQALHVCFESAAHSGQMKARHQLLKRQRIAALVKGNVRTFNRRYEL